MKNFVLLVALAAIVVFYGNKAFAEEVKTLRGEFVDVTCHVASVPNSDSKASRLVCLRSGAPAGMVEAETGRIFLVVDPAHKGNPATKVMPYVGKFVEVKAVVNEKGGMSTMAIKDIKELPNPYEKKPDTK